jgi:hypothetical protein
MHENKQNQAAFPDQRLIFSAVEPFGRNIVDQRNPGSVVGVGQEVLGRNSEIRFPNAPPMP